MKHFDADFIRWVTHRSRVSTVVALGTSLACLGLVIGLKAGAKDLGYLVAGAGLGAIASSKLSNEVAKDSRRYLSSYQDLSEQARANVLYHELQKDPVVLHEAHWSTLGSAVAIIGASQDKALKLASKIMSKSGRSLLVSASPPNEPLVNQTVIPGEDENCTLEDILNYRQFPSYPYIIQALNREQEQRLKDPSLRDPLVVVLDSPPLFPVVTQGVGIQYIVITDMAEVPSGWDYVELGAAAIALAKRSPNREYWGEVMKLWDAGEYPCSINGRFARLR